MATLNGTIHQSFSPVSFQQSAKNLSFDFRSNYLVSANVPKRYQIRWQNGINEAYTPTNEGDVVNIVFYIYATTQHIDGSFVPITEWDLVATIKKSRDLVNRAYNSSTLENHQRFTIDISQICQDLLSYSLVPIGKGTWQSSLWGGMNGGQTKQDNVTQSVSEYNVTPNGTYRHIRVIAKPEVLTADGLIEEATNTITFPDIAVINSVHQFEENEVWLFNRFLIGSNVGGFLSYCPNNNDSSTIKPALVKSMRVDETAEYLYFYIRKARVGTNTKVEGVNLKIETSDGNTFYVDDFSSNLDFDSSVSQFYLDQNKMCVQNVSIDFLNNNAKQQDGTVYSGSKITDSTEFYKVSLFFDRFGQSEIQMSEYRWYKVDRESKKTPYDFVRLHWLNRMGGIDSYTAKRNVAESIVVNRDTVERRAADRTWYQNSKDGTGATIADADYINNTMRGGNLYKGGREVLNVNANRNNSVYTEPLNKVTAQWLEEIMTSPNVWIEMDTDATARGNTANSYQRPSTKEYIPVIITNGSAETVNQETGLVSFNIEYTLAHKVQTQRN